MNTNYLTTKEAAAEIGVGLREMQRKIKAGIVPATKRGGVWFIARADLDTARESHERGPGRPAQQAAKETE
jgi:excisionase family DNA binding protein